LQYYMGTITEQILRPIRFNHSTNEELRPSLGQLFTKKFRLAEAFLTLHRGGEFTEIRFRRTPPHPEIASAIGTRFFKSVEGELMDADININTLYQDGKLQSWTLKPAVVGPNPISNP
jgi:hypothetical protein